MGAWLSLGVCSPALSQTATPVSSPVTTEVAVLVHATGTFEAKVTLLPADDSTQSPLLGRDGA